MRCVNGEEMCEQGEQREVCTMRTKRDVNKENEKEYVGCFLSDSSLPVTWTSDEMTVELCVEICRPLNTTYAFLSPSDCRCNDTLPLNRTEDCTSTCANSENQICGNTRSSVSVFRIDEYPLYGSCDELFDSGIRRHGSYILMNATQTCQFYDSSAVCKEGWYAMDGTCYTVLLTPTTGYEYQSVDDWRSACGQIGGRLVTINNPKQQQFIAKIIMGSERLVKPTVLVGYSESILFGASTWASGSLSEYLKDPSVPENSYQQRVLFEDQQYLNTIISTSSDTFLAGAAVCETEKDFIGVFKPPTHLGPSILRYGIMTLTQCKQVCIGGNHTYAILGNDTCWCGNQTDVDLLVPDVSGTIDRVINSSQIYCPGNQLQRCPANRDNVDVYSIEFDLEFPAASCDHLYSHGVFFNATYKIQNENETSYQTCGFTDNTDCGSVPLFVGYRGRCYKFGTVMTYGASCFSTDSFPILPSEDDELITTLKQIVPVFKTNMRLTIGTSNRLQNGYFTTSEGFFLNSHPAVTSNCLATFVTLNLSSMVWEEASGMQYEICKAPQNSSIICIDTSSLNGTVVFEQRDIYPMTSSICIHVCLGRDSNHAVVHEKGCQCFNSTSYEQTFGECEVCSGHETQMCGDESRGRGVLIDLDFYRNETAQSCEELQSYGIQVPGQYYINPNNTRYLVTCFDQDPSLSVVTEYSATPSSLYSGLINQGFRINVYSNYCVDHSWAPDDSDLDPYLDFKFKEDYIITAIETQGDVLRESWVKSYSLMYKNMENADAFITIAGVTEIAGNVDSHSRVTQFFPLPVITRQLRLFPQSFHQDGSLRVAFHGQPLSNFNHSIRYLGCILDIDGEFVVKSLIDSGGTCRSTCMASYHQFYSYYENQNSTKHCLCGKSLSVYGRTQESWCFPYPYTPALPVYRTYDTYCEARSENNANLVSSELPHSHNFYSVSSKLDYECDEGYILANNATSKSVICRESNGSYYWQDDAGICLVKNCSSLNQSNAWYNLSTSSVAVGTSVTVTCTNDKYMADGSNTKTLTCLSTALWNDTVTPCNYNYCPLSPSTLTNGKYVVSQDELSATYSCNQFYQLSSKSNQEIITCQQNHLWENINFTCAINDTNVAFRQAEFDLVGLFDRQRNAGSVISDSVSSSLFKCTDKCLKNACCTAYSYRVNGSVCILFNSRAQAVELVHDVSWKYFELNTLFME
ncbi:uncharacterized protein LOC125646371 isoform X2 [Ostrea edulis]|uniref:uncharacterized protein LOC125646371 isoform X2 n=1 Tax=Ostrea edulis TaxID=37623 RepID=UPI0024AF5B50|nr:uncharacterized protein LOC125646371 isoform X2 [Ostrea edulis]